MTKEQWITKLLRNPKYSSPWIDRASTILNDYPEEDLTEEYLAQYDSDQLSILINMLKYNKSSADHTIDLDIYAKPEFNDTQMHLFYTVFSQAKGDFEDLLEQIADPKYTYEKLNYVCNGIIAGLNLVDHIDDYDPTQLAALYAGFEAGVDIKVYDDNSIPGYMMDLMLHALQFGNTEVKYDFDTKSLIITEAGEDATMPISNVQAGVPDGSRFKAINK